mgnify:FL=1
MNTGAEIDLDITNVAHGGVFVGRHEGRVIFAPDTLPGARARVRLTETGKASFWRAETLEVLDESPHRLPHIWPDADISVAPELRPGGADFGHIALAHQRELKKFVLADSLQRMAGLDVDLEIKPAGSTEPGAASADEESLDGSGWRTRLSLHVDENGKVGPYAARSHRVIEVGSHPLAAPGLESVALTLQGLEPGRIDLVQGADGMIRLLQRPETTGRRGSAGAVTAESVAPAPTGAARGKGKAKGKGRRVRTRPAAAPVDPQLFATLIERVGEREFQMDAGGFWQVHRLAPATLTAAVQAAVATVDFDAEASNLDLYGGVGLLAAALGDVGGAATRVTSIESDARATDHAGENLAEWVGARAETSRVDHYLTRLLAEGTPIERSRLRRGTVVLDPPRSGAGAAVVRSLARVQPEAVIYVACDPVALARDVATFAEEGYSLRSVTAYDLFPNSHHVEAVAVLSR